MKKILLALILVLLPVMAMATDVQPTPISGGYFWNLKATAAIAATADSYTMVGTMNCSQYSALITTSGTTNLTAAFKVGSDTSNMSTVVTYTLSTDVTRGYTWSFPTPRMYVTFTITGGQVDTFVVYCKGR